VAAKGAGADKAAKKRRTAASGGTTAKLLRTKPGNPGYAGYEYQILVTVWVALDLMLAKQATGVINIEPPSDEDIEASVLNPEAVSLNAEAKCDNIDLVIQVKTRSGSPWPATAIADILCGEQKTKKGSAKTRARPLAMLDASPKRRYVFVTNESSAEALRPHEGEHLFDFPEIEELPPHSRKGYDKTVRADLGPRIVLLTGVTEEALMSRIHLNLEQFAHVAKPKHEACVQELRNEVRARIRGKHGGIWKREELLTVLTRYGGSIAATRDMDHYVRPISYDKIKERLDKDHAVVISGPSGTGKTLTADILELNLRRGNPPFDVIGEEKGPGHVRHHLTRSDPILFHLRDPWGGNRLAPDADRWSGELSKLIANAGPGRKFLVTSRSDIMKSAGYELTKELDPYIVPIEIEDYGPAKLAEIYDGIASDLTGYALTLSASHRGAALQALGRPYEINRFLVALSHEDSDSPRKAVDIISDSQIDAISRVIADQIAPLEIDGAQSATIIWSLLSARGALARDVFVKLSRRLRTSDSNLRPDVEGLIDFLVAGKNLRQDGAALSFYHPRVEDGLRLAFMKKQGEAEFLLGKIVDLLAAWDEPEADWGIETALGVLRAVDRVGGLQLELTSSTKTRMNEFLDAVALSAQKRFDFDKALQDLIKFGSTNHYPSILARILIEGAEIEEKPFFGKRWRAPKINGRDKQALRADHRTQGIVERFIREVLPFTNVDYHPEVVALLSELASDLHDAYWDAFDIVAGPGGPHENIAAILQGVLSEEAPDYDRAIERLAQSQSEFDDWMKEFSEDLYRAEEHAVDADLADRDVEEPGERHFNIQKGLEELVKVRREREGVQWIAGHPNAELVANSLADIILHSPKAPGLEELRLLLDVSGGWGREKTWSAVQVHWDEAFRTDLLADLGRSDLEFAALRKRLIKIAALSGVAGSFIELLSKSVATATPERRLELLYDIMSSHLDNDPKGEEGLPVRCGRAKGVVETYPVEEQELARALIDLLAGNDIKVTASALSTEASLWAEKILPNVSNDVAGPLACLLAGADVNVQSSIDQLLATGVVEDGLVALQALHIADKPDQRVTLTNLLVHKRFRVRQRSLELLVPDAIDKAEREYIVKVAASDQSADVRLTFARLMKEHSWHEAAGALTSLMGDTRNFASHLTQSSWSRFSVARAAAGALGGYEELPKEAIDELLAVANVGCDDPFVACAALASLARHQDDRISEALIAGLKSPGLTGDPTYRPRAQAAAWAVFDRAVAKKLNHTEAVDKMAAHEPPNVAGPLLLAIGVMGGPERQLLLDRLRQDGFEDRIGLVRIASIAADEIEGLSLDDREQNLLRLIKGESFDEIGPQAQSILESWAVSLDCEAGFERFMAWILGDVLGLPITSSVGAIRALDLPERIQVLTMRSMSPDREQEADPDDGT
tara:strand:+ start:1813 stop:6096 length:4284 start_codon:yes stop_codon:yes gene_type:complete